MTQTLRAPKPQRIALSLILFVTFPFTAVTWAKEKRPAAKAKAQSARSDKSKRAVVDKRRDKLARETRADRRRNTSSVRDRRNSKEDNRRLAKKDDNRRDNRKLSRRERLAEARRLAERLRRERIEAARRAEAARQAALARQRAADQALRDEAAANIANDDATGEDLEVRRAAVAALGNHAGTVVAMDPKTGRIYSIVNQEWALRRGYKPCSTIKLVTGLAGLGESVIDPLQTVSVSDRRYAIDLTDSLAYSNNGYFQAIGGLVGFERIMNYAREMGLGQPTGINHANEYAGRVPMFKTGYAVNHMSSHGDDFEVTPIQLATLTSAIANGGSMLVPHLPRTPQEDAQFKTEVRRKLNVPLETLRRLVPGMIGTVNYGSGKLAYNPTQTIAGKTGTCIGQGSWLGLFTSYAPAHDPRLAVVVVTRGSGERGRVAAAIAGKVYRSLGSRFGRINTDQIATTPESLMPQPKINPKAAAAVSDEDMEAAAADASGGDVTGAATTEAPGSNVKSTTMTVTPRKTEVTTVPAATQTPGQPKSNERPRRVLTTQQP